MGDLLQAALGPAPVSALTLAFLAGNLAAGAAVAGVCLARIPVRRVFGAGAVSDLWAFPPLVFALAFGVALVPADSVTWSAAAAAAIRLPDLTFAALAWALGAAFMMLRLAVAQARFEAELRAGRAGPAVVGLISPRIVLPADDGQYSTEERDLIRAHERAHVARKDPRSAAAAALFQCLCWFNPLVHLAAFLMRLDQELACDAAVVISRPHARALYARTLLKTQMAAMPLPLGCYWPARGQHPLEVRIALLRPRPGQSTARPEGGLVFAPAVDAIRP
jgi:beta-lactamase regulating signal transducer with metallopeptidase domain